MIGVLQLLNELKADSRGVSANSVGVFSCNVGVINKLILLALFDIIWLFWFEQPNRFIAKFCISTVVAKEGVINWLDEKLDGDEPDVVIDGVFKFKLFGLCIVELLSWDGAWNGLYWLLWLWFDCCCCCCCCWFSWWNCCWMFGGFDVGVRTFLVKSKWFRIVSKWLAEFGVTIAVVWAAKWCADCWWAPGNSKRLKFFSLYEWFNAASNLDCMFSLGMDIWCWCCCCCCWSM